MLIKMTNPLEHCQLKFASNDEYKFEGYLSKFNSTDNIGDTVMPGAFDKSLAASKSMPFFVNHEHMSIPLGELKGETDDYGLKVYGDINPDHFLAKTAYTAMKLKHMQGLSMGYVIPAGGFEKKADGRGRYLKEVLLKEGSLVTFPCEELAQIVSVKADLLECKSLHDFERHLRDAYGASKSEAVAFVSLLVKHARSESVHEDPQITGMEAKLASTIFEFGQRFK